MNSSFSENWPMAILALLGTSASNVEALLGQVKELSAELQLLKDKVNALEKPADV